MALATKLPEPSEPVKSKNRKKRKSKNQKKRSPSAHFISPPQTMEITGWGQIQTYELLRSGQMPHIKIGTHYWISKDKLMLWLQDVAEGRVTLLPIIP